MTGKVYIIGAGPGNPDLITVKGLECIKSADVIIYDNLVNEKLLSYAKDSTEKIYAGKIAGNHSMQQEEINRLLVEKAQQNKVVRLKGGDPFVFGRGGEEALFLKKHNIDFEIIPGISSCHAVLTYAGIPITLRGASSSFHVITGHESPEKEAKTINYEILAKLSGTLVFMMGLNNLKLICSELIRYGKDPKTPAAIIANGTCPNQHIVTGTLENINADNSVSPAIIIIGEVVNLRESLKWFENAPLFGSKILVTRAKHQNRELVQKIEELGGEAVEFPTIEINAYQNNEIYNNLDNYNWIIFTSTNGVEIFFKQFLKTHKDIRELGNAKFAAVGKATAQAIEKFNLSVDFVPDEYVGESLAIGLKDKINRQDSILIPRAEQAREILPEELRKTGAKVDIMPLYKTVIPHYKRDELINAVEQVDRITFTSSSTVTNFIEMLGKDNLYLLKDKKTYCIGPITAKTAKQTGLFPENPDNEYSIEGLIRTMTEGTK